MYASILSSRKRLLKYAIIYIYMIFPALSFAEEAVVDDNGVTPFDIFGCELAAPSTTSHHFEYFYNDSSSRGDCSTGTDELCWDDISSSNSNQLFATDSSTLNICEDGDPASYIDPVDVPRFFECAWSLFVGVPEYDAGGAMIGYRGIDSSDDAYLFPDPALSPFTTAPGYDPLTLGSYRIPLWAERCLHYDSDSSEFIGGTNSAWFSQYGQSIRLNTTRMDTSVLGCLRYTAGGIDSVAIHEFAHHVFKGMSKYFNSGWLPFVNEGFAEYTESVLSPDFEDPGAPLISGYTLVEPLHNFANGSLRAQTYAGAARFWYYLATHFSNYPDGGQFYTLADVPPTCQTYSLGIGEDANSSGTAVSPPWMRRLPGRDIVYSVQSAFSECHPNGPTAADQPFCDGADCPDPTPLCAAGERPCCAGDIGCPLAGCVPDDDCDDDANCNHHLGELMMPLALELVDQGLSDIGNADFDAIDDRDLGMRYVAFRDFLINDYQQHALANSGIGEAVDRIDDPATTEQEDDFRLKSFGAHYHELDMTHLVHGVDMYVDIDVEYGDGAFAAGGSLMPEGTEVWATVLNVHYDSAGGGTVTTDVALPWIRLEEDGDPDSNGDVLVFTRDIAYETAVVIVTAFEGTYPPGIEANCSDADLTDDPSLIDDDWQCSGGIYSLRFDSDNDGVSDDVDNCLLASNPDQANCDQLADDAEGVSLGMSGDACDPDLCLELLSEPRPSHKFAGLSGGRVFWIVGEGSSYRFRGIGGESLDPNVPDDRVYHPIQEYQQKNAPVRMSHCTCEQGVDSSGEETGRCKNYTGHCVEFGINFYQWHDSFWRLSDSNRESEVGEGSHVAGNGDLLPDIHFERPQPDGSFADDDNDYEVEWLWQESYPGEDEIEARIWLRPDQDSMIAELSGSYNCKLPGEECWPLTRGNTYSKVARHSERWDSKVWMPADVIHGNLEEVFGIINPPRAIDLIEGRIDLPGDCDPWCGLVGEPFELPSLVTAGRELDSPLRESRFALDVDSSSALSAIMVRHQWSESGFVSEYVPLAFEGGGQLDNRRFASTVMIESPENPSEAEDLNDALSLWTFGGENIEGKPYNAFWRGALDRSGNDPVYRFSPISFTNGPRARIDATLLADTSWQRLFLFGGSNEGMLDELWLYDVKQQQWDQIQGLTPNTIGLSRVAALVVGHTAYLYGGARSYKDISDELWRLDLHTLEFERFDGYGGEDYPPPLTGASLAMDSAEEILYLYGGQIEGVDWTNELWAYDIAEDRWELLAPACQSGPDCPPAAMGSAILSAGTRDVVTLALGTPRENWEDTNHEWRYVVWQDLWIPEMEARGTWQQ